MAADFGTELDAALNRGLERVKAAAAAAKERIGTPADEAPATDEVASHDARTPAARGAAAVSFDMDEPNELGDALHFPDAPIDALALDGMDAEGIPLPEEIPPQNA